MAAMENKIGTALVLKKLVETSIDGKEKFKTQRFSKVKVTAKAEDIYAVAKAMEDVIHYPIKEVFREDISSVLEE